MEHTLSASVGTSGYTLGCRCEGCVSARRAYMKRWRAQRGSELRIGVRAKQKRAYDTARSQKRAAD